ncbi:MAG: protein kinase [Myxococcales bacterium]|nr:protein kinase [Myxococcales bacterium]MDD9969200.1 protein kinase [Myxococcales bacterium]
MQMDLGSGVAIAQGTVVGDRYRVGRLIGRGGMGAVYEGVHVGLGRRVAIKTAAPERCSDDRSADRLVREARAAAAIEHPGIVQVFDLVYESGIAFVVMECLEGEELAERIERDGPVEPDFAIRLGLELCDAVGAAHAHGVLHRDLKPRNIFLLREQRSERLSKILDFGIARLMEPSATELQTRSDHVVGTPVYMAPERLAGERVLDARVDVYAIGVILYEMLAGEPPFRAANYPELVLRITTETPRPLDSHRPELPRPLCQAVAQAMEKRPEGRFASVQALGRALREVQTEGAPASFTPDAGATHVDTLPTAVRSGQRADPTRQPSVVTSHRRAWALAGIATSTTLAMLAWALSRDAPASPDPRAGVSLSPVRLVARPVAERASGGRVAVSANADPMPPRASTPPVPPPSTQEDVGAMNGPTGAGRGDQSGARVSAASRPPRPRTSERPRAASSARSPAKRRKPPRKPTAVLPESQDHPPEPTPLADELMPPPLVEEF